MPLYRLIETRAYESRVIVRAEDEDAVQGIISEWLGAIGGEGPGDAEIVAVEQPDGDESWSLGYRIEPLSDEEAAQFE